MPLRNQVFSRYLSLLILSLLWAGAVLELGNTREWAEASSGSEAAYLAFSLGDGDGQASLERLQRSPLGKKFLEPLPFSFPETPISLFLIPQNFNRYVRSPFPSGDHQSLLHSLNSH